MKEVKVLEVSNEQHKILVKCIFSFRKQPQLKLDNTFSLKETGSYQS